MKRTVIAAFIAAYLCFASAYLQFRDPMPSNAQPNKIPSQAQGRVLPKKAPQKAIVKPKPEKKFNLGDGNAMTDSEIKTFLQHTPNGSQLLPYYKMVGKSCRKWGVNPALLIAMFQMESNLGRHMVKNTNNIGNLRKNSMGFKPSGTPPVRYVRVHRGPHAVFKSRADAINAYCWTIRTAYLNRGRTTIPAIISVYAPKSDGNDPDGYAKAVRQIMDAAL